MGLRSGIWFAVGGCISKLQVLEAAFCTMGAEWLCTQHLPFQKACSGFPRK